MWEEQKGKRPQILLSLAYHDFAMVEVEKKTSRQGVTFYEIRVHIEEVTDQNFEFYRLSEVTEALRIIKECIENLYEQMDETDPRSVYDWLDDFVDRVSGI